MKSKSTTSAQLFSLLFLTVMAVLFPASICAQEARGTITGKVIDSSQAIVPGATVKVTNVAMGTTVSATTNEAGLYFAPFLIPGTYQILVEATGFKKFLREGIILRVNDTLEIDIQLEVGAVGETVTVTGEAPALETASASIGQVVDSRRVAELPIGHGDPYALIGLAGGTTFARSQRLDRPFEPTHIVGFTVNGTRANRSDLTVDGVASTATANGGEVIASFVPPQDLVQEFKVQTATFDAQFGNTEGGVTNLSIKSGTNQFHGSAYYANFTPGTSANDFYSNTNNRPIGDFYYHRFGGTFLGPVIVPKLYDGKNKTFFTYGFEAIPEARPRNDSDNPQIPTVRMRSGDFTEMPGSFQLYNPYTGVRGADNVIRREPFKCNPDGTPVTPVNGIQTGGTNCNKIPAELFNPVALNFINNYLPLPTSAPTSADGTRNFLQPDLREPVKYYSNTIRIDHVVSEKQRLFGRASWYNRNSNYNNYYQNLATGTHFEFVSRQAAIDDVYTLNSSTVLNLRYGYNRFIRLNDTNLDNHGFDITSLGFPASYANLIDPDVRRFPRFDFTGYQGTSVSGENRPIDTHNVVAVVNRAQGAHSLKFGTEFRAYRETASFFANDQSGRFNFDSTYVKSASDVNISNNLGYSFAALLLGIPTSGQINQPANYAETSTTWGFFFQDDWRVNSRLTLNLGLRYEFEGPLTERYNRSVRGFDYNFVQPIEADAQRAFIASQNGSNATPEITQFNVRGGLTFAGVNGEPRGLYETPKKNFMPRIGFAYKLNEKTVVRGGYGIFYGFLGQRRGDVVQNGFATSTTLNVTQTSGAIPAGGGSPFIETLSNPFQSGLQTPSGSSLGGETFLGRNLGNGMGSNPTPGFFNTNPLSPYNQRWQVGFQRELPAGFVAEASYVGNRGTHVEILRNINAVPNKYLITSSDPVADNARNAYLTADVPNPFSGMTGKVDSSRTGSTIQRQELLRPYPQFGDIWTTTNEGYSWYHSLQLNLEKRFSRGYTINANYTYSKFMEATDLLNQGDTRPTEILSASDIPHRFTVSSIYELPFGKGRRFLSAPSSRMASVASHIVGGWQISGIYALQSGAPIGNWSNGNGNWGNVLYLGDIQDIEIPQDQRSLSHMFKTDGFVALRTSTSASSWVRDSNGQPVWVSYNDPCKNSYNPTTCPGTPLTDLTGLWNRDTTFRPAGNARTLPTRFGFLRVPRTNNFDFGISKKAKLGEGSKELHFRADLLNAFNHPLLFAPDQVNMDPTAAAFGQVTAGTQANYPRRVQLTLRFLF